jgi:hypothetical protein
MLLSRLRPTAIAVLLVALFAGGVLLAYAQWTDPLIESSRAVCDG